MELLAPVIEDFPYDYNPATGSLKTTDYDQALEIVKQWFKANPDYMIIRDTF